MDSIAQEGMGAWVLATGLLASFALVYLLKKEPEKKKT
jgi:hypothetical protein